jgi:hypothetical protein
MNNYKEVLISLEQGKKAYRDGWLGHGKLYIFLKENDKIPNISVHAKDGGIHKYKASNVDIIYNDWNILE